MALSVFPDRMNKIDPEDAEKSLRTIDSYIRYMVDQVEFTLTQNFRTVNGLGSSGEAISLVLTQTVNNLSALTSVVNGKVDKVDGKGLSSNDYTDADQTKLAGIEAGAQVNEVTGEEFADLEDRVETLEDVISAAGPILIQNAEDVTAAEGDNAIFSVRAAGSNLTYKWELYYSSSWIYPNFPGRDTPNMTVTATSSRNGYRFRCTVTGGGWTIYSKTVTLHVT